MSDDPYRELELYLQKAQEEIGLAVKELEEHQDKVPEQQSERTTTSTHIHSPFRSQYDVKNTKNTPFVCSDRHPLHNGTLPNYFRSNIRSEKEYSPNTRRRLWRMHPSISFPETSKDLLLLEPSTTPLSSRVNGYSDSSGKSETLGRNVITKSRQRSNSDPPRFTPDIPEEFRPPSGDVNLLLIWADKLVLELDKSLSGELNSSHLSSDSKKEDTTIYEDSFRYLKNASVSPDSGIEQMTWETSEVDSYSKDPSNSIPIQTEHCVDSVAIPRNFQTPICDNVGKSHDVPDNAQSCITIHPEQKSESSFYDLTNNSNHTPKSFPKDSTAFVEEKVEYSFHDAINSDFRIEPIAPPHQFEDKVAFTDIPNRNRNGWTQTENSICSNINDENMVRAVNNYHNVKNDNEMINVQNHNDSNSSVSKPTFYSLPKYQRRTLNEKCNTLPKDWGKCSDSPPDPQLARISFLAIDDVAEFIRQVKTSQPPVKDDKDTQTSPLSRSSSFTWVTDCECSDWDGRNSSDNNSESSLYLSACSGSSDSFEDYTSLKGSTLGEISEESFPLKCLISDRCLKCVSAPALTRRNLNSKISSSSDSSPPTETQNEDTSKNRLYVRGTGKKSILNAIICELITRAKNGFQDSTPITLASWRRKTQIPTRPHSAKELNELQAIEACSWLRAAGFPQYAQMYEDSQFPIDVSIVQKDHAFLHPDSIQSLFRRLNTLNRCAKMKFKDHVHRASLQMDESDDEEQYALSENWEFERTNRRWSRIPSPSDGISEFVSNDSTMPSKTCSYTLTTPTKKFLGPEEAYCSSHDSVFIDDQHSSPDSVRRSIMLKNEKISTPSIHLGDGSPGSSSGSGGTLSLASEDIQQERRSLRRSGSDRVKEGAKALLKRMESLKGKRKKKVLDANRIDSIPIAHSGTEGSSSSSLTSSPQFHRPQKHVTIVPESSIKRKTIKYKGDNLSTHSDTECRLFLVAERWKDANSNDTKPTNHYITSQTSVTVTCPQEETHIRPIGESRKCDGQFKPKTKNLLHPGSHNGIEWEDCDKRGSYYDNVCAPLVVFNELYAESLDESRCNNSANTGKSHSSLDNSIQSQEDGDIIIMNTERRDSGVGSSLTRGITYQQAPWHCFPFTSSEPKGLSGPLRTTDLTAPQFLLLRKLSLLKLTTIMEKFSPSSRTGWSWGVSKFICRIRNPDYKDKVVFGVPLLLILQRTGQPLPVSIQAAIHHLRSTALDSTGLFRKSGVRSRIQKLKSLNETFPDKINYEEQQAYDVADMLKQYFRELPEALLTNKLSETFISIFQFVPVELRLEAIHAALMLMPDENREVLQSLLEFLQEVCQHSGVNQMTATNLAVCFAPSLFHLSTPRSASSSPRRRKTVGVPDLRELNENRAAYECLSCMVTNYKTLFTVSEEIISQSRISSTSYSLPASLEELYSFASPNGQTGLKGFIDSCIQMFLKESKEKYKGWKTISQNDHVDLSFKKLVDGHPLKLWKVSTEVEAPPVELLNRILTERNVWDGSFSKGKVVIRLNKQTDVVQYSSSSLPPHPPCDFCILRSWRTDLPKGACILIETSVEHADSEISSGSIRGLILCSRFLIEPCGSGKSRITHISRVDTRGRSPEWYNRAYGHICTLLLVKLRNSFLRSRAEGPETKV